MNDELKKIIKEIECYQNEDMCMIMLSQKENKALLDYINNLQQAVKDTKETADDMLYELNEENDRLKLELSGYREAILRDDTLLGLQERIDKAIEYIENDTFKCKNQEEQLNYDYDLLDILRGEDNE